MKKIITICAAILMTASVFAQAPNKMSYQAVIRNTSNALVTNSAVGMRISILQTSTSGISVYVETQTPTTNANGLASIEIGGGSVITGNFSTINWANGPFFIKTETDPLGGTNYSISGTSQLLSVPYALYAKNAGSLQNDVKTFFSIVGTGQLASSTQQKITLSTNVSYLYNPNNFYNTATDEFIVPISGTYQFDITMSGAGNFYIKKNGVEQLLLPSGTNYISCSYGNCNNSRKLIVTNLIAGDLISFWAIGWADGGISSNFNGGISGYRIE